jgi:hypothetical protein
MRATRRRVRRHARDGFVLIHCSASTGTSTRWAREPRVGATFAWLGRRRRAVDLAGGERPCCAPRCSRSTARCAAGRLRDDGAADRLDPGRRARVRRVRVHVHDGRRGVRALHRARQLRGVARARIGRAVLPRALWISIALHGLYFWLETSPYWAHRVRIAYSRLDAAFYPYYFAVFMWVLISSVPRCCSRARCCHCSSTRYAARSAISVRRRAASTA